MKVILKEKVRNLGVIGDIVEARNGYARNFLIPQGKAINYTALNYKIFEEQKQKLAEENAAKIKAAQEVQSSLTKKTIKIIENSGDDGKLYGSINSATIARKANEILGESRLTRANILLNQAIKYIGDYTATIEPHPEVQFEIKIIIGRSDEEIEEIAKGNYKKKEEGGGDQNSNKGDKVISSDKGISRDKESGKEKAQGKKSEEESSAKQTPDPSDEGEQNEEVKEKGDKEEDNS